MRLLAASVHVFTALGAVAALFAALAIFDQAWERLFFWLGVALVIDGIDGTFARGAKVQERLPRFSGENLDLVVDYVTYVFVPTLALLRASFLDGWLGLALAAGILLSSLFHFADLKSKAEDYAFIGFPAIWNVVAFYVFAFGLSAPATAVVVGLCIAATFYPSRWVHPVRGVALWPLTAAMTAAWSAAALATLWNGFPAELWAKVVLLIVAAYGIGLTLVRRGPD